MMDLAADRTVTLPDGRLLAFRDLGPADAPCVVFEPGFMASRLTGREVGGARVLAVDRPGIGRSTAVPHRTLSSTAADVGALVDLLGVERFAVLGHSAGGPYAAACAAVLGDRVRALGIACGFSPMDRADATSGMNRRMASAVPMLRRLPWLARLVTSGLPKQYEKDPEKAFEKQFGRDLPECDREALRETEVRQRLLDAAVEATRQGARPLAEEMQLTFSRPWNLDLAAITAPTHLWYGADDTLTPPAMGRYLAERIPHANITVFNGEGHMAAFNHWSTIIATLVAS
jgi:pimeloyl-ACP methyl ester carboxylesterase